MTSHSFVKLPGRPSANNRIIVGGLGTILKLSEPRTRSASKLFARMTDCAVGDFEVATCAPAAARFHHRKKCIDRCRGTERKCRDGKRRQTLNGCLLLNTARICRVPFHTPCRRLDDKVIEDADHSITSHARLSL